MNWWDLLKVGLPAVLGFFAGRLSKRLDRRQERKDEDSAKAPEFALTHEKGSRFRLTNTGSAPATNVTLDLGDHPVGLTRDVPVKADLAKDGSTTFIIGSNFGQRRPHQCMVTCDELASPVPLAIPAVP